MTTKYDDYASKFETIKFKREDDILEMTVHTNGGSLRWGPVAHTELEQAFLDIVLGSEDCAFQDSAHFRGGMVPGDGVNAVFQLLMGMNRGRYFLYTAQTIHAKQALDCGLVSELLPKDEVLARAWEHARILMKQSAMNRRYTRWVLTEPLRRQMNEILGYGLTLEGLVICQQ